MRKINELIRDTGYQYYSYGLSDLFNFFVFMREEAEKLRKERGWKLI